MNHPPESVKGRVGNLHVTSTSSTEYQHQEQGAIISCPPTCFGYVPSPVIPYVTFTNHNTATFVSGSFVLHISFDVFRDFCDINNVHHFSYIELRGGKFHFYCRSTVSSPSLKSVLLYEFLSCCGN
jgi:hypothetical protein